MEPLYGALAGRWFAQINNVIPLRAAPCDALTADEIATFLSGQAYVKALRGSTHRHGDGDKGVRSGADYAISAAPYAGGLIPTERLRVPALPFTVVGLDPTAGNWPGMESGTKDMPAVTLSVSAAPGGATVSLASVEWHTTNASFIENALAVRASVVCIDGPSDTNGLSIQEDWSDWDRNVHGAQRRAESELAAVGVGLFWTTFNTINAFDGASRWVARSLRIFHDLNALAQESKPLAVETHPHGAFTFLGGTPLAKKKTSEGRSQRLSILARFINRVTPQALPDDDAVDAACAALVGVMFGLGGGRPYGAAGDGGVIWMP